MRLEIEQMLDLCPYTFEQLTRKNRTRDLVYWRNAIMYNLREKGYRFQEIADALGMNHSTIIHGCNHVINAIQGFNRDQLKIYKFTNMVVPTDKIYCTQMRRSIIAPSKVYKQATR